MNANEVRKGFIYCFDSSFSYIMSFFKDRVADLWEGLLILLNTISLGSALLQGDGKTCDNWLSKRTWSIPLDFDQDEGEFIMILDLGVLISLGELKDFSEII